MSVAIGPGSTFAGYRIESFLGRGGMGVVYRATDLSLERPVALKLIAPELAEDERFRTRFLNEPRLAASLDHPHVVPIYEAGESDGQLFLAMRFVDGTTLKALVERDRRLSGERAVTILAQIAGALDAAHRRGLVHLDVKPANVLLDEDGHAYLSDFGISRRTDVVSTDAGSMSGTLDYLAPEQIRGEEVDGRTDQYALGCVLHECLAGTPPFRRATDPETMWAHLHENPAPLPGEPRLDPVLGGAMAKEKDERYASCSEMTEAAGRALGLATAASGPPRPRGPWLVRHRRAAVAAGVVALGVAGAAALISLTSGGGSAERPPVGSGIAAIDPSGGHVGALIESATAPSNVAVGEGAVWALSTTDATIARIDPATKAVTGRIRTRGVPTDIAAGGGAVWVGNTSGKEGANYTESVSRIDPRSGAITHTAKLPNPTSGSLFEATLNWGIPDIAVGGGAVWARNPDFTVSRIDPRTGAVTATVDTRVDALAAGREGVWGLTDSAVVRIDPRTNRIAQTIPVASSTSAIAVGAGSVWVTSQQQGVVFRIDPRTRPSTRAIDVGPGVTFIAFGNGAAWTANYVDGTVSRIDPRTNAVTARVPIGAAQAMAAGAGSVWVSTAGGTRAGGLPDSACGRLVAGGRTPDVLITSDLPLQGSLSAGPRAMADAIELVLSKRGFKAGDHAVGYRSCDDSTAQTGAFENRRCAANANAYAQAKRLVAVIGPFNSDCASIEIPILNRAAGGPLAMISPTNTYAGLTRRGSPPPMGYRGEPGVYYPTGKRNFVRLLAGDDVHGAAEAVLAKRLGLASVYLVHTDPWASFLTDPFRRMANRIGLPIAGSATFDPSAKSFTALAERVARSGADGVVLGADPFDGGDRLVRALRARLGSRVTLMGSFAFSFARDVLEQTGRAGRGLYVASYDMPSTALPMTVAGRRFARDAGALTTPLFGVLEAGQAAEVVLDAIARSDGSRASVLEELRRTKVRNGILGSFSFDGNGDIVPASVPILRLTGRTPPGAGLPPEFEGAVVDRVVKLPSSSSG
jgi:ABC-type branched-subunit amino acid transport system substrate-binding protein